MKVSEQLLTSFSIDLNYLEKYLAKLSQEEVSLFREDLQLVLDSLDSAQIQLAELLHSEQETCQCGVSSVGTSV